MTRNAEFEILGLSSDASWDDVKRAFRRLARAYHPDVAGSSGTRKFAEITEAYMTLKDAAHGLGKIPARRSPRAGAGRTSGRGKPIFEKFKRLWRMILSFRRKRRTKEKHSAGAGVSAAAARFIDGVIARAESEMRGVLSRGEESAARVKSDAIIRRLKSRRPAVTLLALGRLSRSGVSDETASAAVEHFRRNIPRGEVLEALLDVFSNSPKRGDMIRALLPHAAGFSEQEAVTLLARLKRWKSGAEFLRPFLSHKSPEVISCALSCWPEDAVSDERSELVFLLRKDDEEILIPLLRVLKREHPPRRAGGRLLILMRDHPSPAVRALASAIVRGQKLG